MIRSALFSLSCIATACFIAPAFAQDSHYSSETRVINVAEELERERQAQAEAAANMDADATATSPTRIDIYGDGQVLIENGAVVEGQAGTAPANSEMSDPAAEAEADMEAETGEEMATEAEVTAAAPVATEPKKTRTQSARERIYEKIRRNRMGE